MKFCSYCGKEILDAAVICVNCGCLVANSTNKSKSNARKIWIIVLLIIFVLSALAIILILTSNHYIRTSRQLSYMHTDLGMLGNWRTEGLLEWQSEVQFLKAKLVPYYIGLGISGVLGLASLIANIFLVPLEIKARKALKNKD